MGQQASTPEPQARWEPDHTTPTLAASEAVTVGTMSSKLQPQTHQTTPIRGTCSQSTRLLDGTVPCVITDYIQDESKSNMIGKYQLGKTIGRGTMGRVKLATDHASGEHVAVKMIGKNKLAANDRSRLDREIQTMKMLRHPNVLRLLEVVTTTSHFNLVVEYAHRDMLEFINTEGAQTEPQAIRMFDNIMQGLSFCHSLSIAHRDLKLENLLLVGDTVKIADFGLANLMKVCEHNHLETMCGSPHYAAPELLGAGAPYNATRSDVWSCGCILYAMLTARLPFDSDNLAHMFQEIQCAQYSMPTEVSEAAQDLIRRMLTVNPEERITVEQILKHRWMTGTQVTPPRIPKAVTMDLALVHLANSREAMPSPTRNSREEEWKGHGSIIPVM